MVRGQRSMATDSLFILLLPGTGSKSKAAYIEVEAAAKPIHFGPGITFRPVFEVFFKYVSMYI